MKIQYNSSIVDITAYAKLIYEKSPTVKQHLKKTYYFSIPMLIVIGAVLKYYESNEDLVVFWALVGIGWLIYLPFFHKKKYIKKVIESFKDTRYEHLFCQHELTIENNIIVDQIENGINKTEISKIEHIETIDNYTFIFIDSAMAYLIPEQEITQGDYNQFIAELRRQLGKQA